MQCAARAARGDESDEFGIDGEAALELETLEARSQPPHERAERRRRQLRAAAHTHFPESVNSSQSIDERQKCFEVFHSSRCSQCSHSGRRSVASTSASLLTRVQLTSSTRRFGQRVAALFRIASPSRPPP